MSDAEIQKSPQEKEPNDRLNLVLIIFFIHGIGCLVGFSAFTVPKAYFVEYKLGSNYTAIDIHYVTNFLPYMGVYGMIPNVIFNWISVFIHESPKSGIYVVVPLLIEMVVFILTISLVLVDSSSWPLLFFWITIISFMIINMANGLYQNRLLSTSCMLPSEYIKIFIAGASFCGFIVTIIHILTLIMVPEAKISAMIFFILTFFILFLCLVTYLALHENNFYTYYQKVHVKNLKNYEVSKTIPYWSIFKKTFIQCFNVFYSFLITFSIFPAVVSDIKMSSKYFVLPQRYFVPVTCYLTYHTFILIGHGLTHIPKLQMPQDKLIVFVMLRTFFVPLFLVMNYQPYGVQRIMPVLIHNDWIYWIMSAFLAITNSYFSIIAFIYLPEQVERQYSVVTGRFGGASLVTGMCLGMFISGYFPWIVSHFSG